MTRHLIFATIGRMNYAGALLALCAAAQWAGAWQAPGAAELLFPDIKSAKEAKSELFTKLKSLDKGLNAQDRQGKSALMLAAEQGNRLVACYLVAQGADVTLRDKQGKTAAQYASSAALRELLEACSGGSAGGVTLSRELQEQQAQAQGLSDPEARRAKLWELVTQPGRLREMADLLRLEVETHGLGPNDRVLLDVPGGVPPEYLAFFVRRGYNLQLKSKDGSSLLRDTTPLPTARLLLALGFQPDEADPHALLVACLVANDGKELKKLLKKDPALATSRTADDHSLLALAQSAEAVAQLIAAGADAKEEGLLRLVIARAEGRPDAEVAQALLKAGAALPENALADLCGRGTAEPRMVRALLAAGADAAVTDAEGNTLLHLLLRNTAAQPHAAAAAQALIKAGADPKAKNQAGQSPLQLAKELGRESVLKPKKSAK